jgi:hypothetical protein
LARHLARGAVGFGLIAAAFVLARVLGPFALVLAPAGFVVLGGCPTCWLVGLASAVSAGRLRRECSENGCKIDAASGVRDVTR